MRTIFNIIVILIVTAIVAAGVYALVENTNPAASSTPEGSQPPNMTGTDGQFTFPEGERPEGREDGSIIGGLAGILILLAKIAGITFLVTWIEKRINHPRKIQSPQAIG